MRNLLKFAVVALVLGVFVLPLGSANAMPVSADPTGPMTLDISGFLTTRFGFVDCGTSYCSSDDAPTIYVGSAEGSINTVFSTSDGEVSGMINIRIRSPSSTLGPRTPSHLYAAGAQLTWRPIENLRIDSGKFVYVSWEEKVCYWDNYLTFRPIPNCGQGEYSWYPEGKEGLDVTYALGGGMNVGLWLSDDQGTDAGDTEVVVEIVSDGDATNGCGPRLTGDGCTYVAQTFIAHFEMRQDWGHLIVLYGSETLTSSGDAWANETESVNTGIVVTGKFFYDEGSWVKGLYEQTEYDTFNQFGQVCDPCETQSHFTAAVEQNIGGPYSVIALFSQTQNHVGFKDAPGTEPGFMRLGVKKIIGEGGRVHLDYELSSNNDLEDTTFIGLGWFHGF